MSRSSPDTADAQTRRLAAERHESSASATLAARTYDSGFRYSHDSYNSLGVGSDGRVYYVLSSESLDEGARMFVFDPGSERIRCLGALTEACGEKGLRAIPQGKSHVNFSEASGKLYFATHVGYYTAVNGIDRMGVPPAGYKPYPGGHLLAYEISTGRFEDLGQAPGQEGVLAMTMDCRRGRVYGLTWPTGSFFRFDLARRELKDFGPMLGQGEDGTGDSYYTICRSLAVDPRSGNAYFTLATGTILCYCYERDAVEAVAGEDLRKDYFGIYDPHSPGHMGYNWRQVLWHPTEEVIYGVHGNSGYLFRFDPRVPRVEVLERITSEPSRRSGMFDQFSYGYLGFALGPDHQTLSYLTGGPIYRDGQRVAGKDSTGRGESKGEENLHLVTYHIPSRRYRDHGAIFFGDGQRPSYVNGIAIGHDGTVYSLSRISEHGRTRADLFRVSLPSLPKAP
jgi:hypothetical protein